MAIELVELDPALDQSPEGRFVISVCNRLAALDFDGLEKLVGGAAWDLDEKPKVPTLFVAPLVEQFLDVEDPDGPATGSGFVALYAAGLMTVEPIDPKKPALFGRHLQWRHQQLTEFGSVERSSIPDADTGRTFELNVTPALKFPRRAIARGMLVSFITVGARYESC